MPRGKNYVNQNKGMTLQASSAADIKEQCYYGAQCQRKDCIYKHDGIVMTMKRTNEPCMAYLAGLCSFTEKTCRKRHPTEDDANALRAKCGAIKCRFQGQCKTKGCLYIHETDDDSGSICRTATDGNATKTVHTTKTNGKNTTHAAAQKIKKKSKPQQPMLSSLEEPNAFPPLPTALGKNGTVETKVNPKNEKMVEPSYENQTTATLDNRNHSQTAPPPPPASVVTAWGPPTAATSPAVTSTQGVSANKAPTKSPSVPNEIPMVAVAAVVPMAWSDVTKRPPHAPMTTAVSSPLPLAGAIPNAPTQPERIDAPAVHHAMFDAHPPPLSQAAYSHHMMMMYHRPPPPLPPSVYPMSMVPSQMMDPYNNPALYHHHDPPELHHMAPHHGQYWAPHNASMMNMDHSIDGSNGVGPNHESLNIHAKEFVPGGATNS